MVKTTVYLPYELQLELGRISATSGRSASLIVLGARYGTDRLLTLDRRHFGVLRTVTGAAFRVLPATKTQADIRGEA